MVAPRRGDRRSRREIVAMLGSEAALVPLAAGAQQATKLPVIGVLSPFVDADSAFLRDLRHSLGDHRLREGQEIAIEYRSAEGRIDRLPALADEFIRLKRDIIATGRAPANRLFQPA